MAKIIALSNQKGRLGKSITVASLGYPKPDELPIILVNIMAGHPSRRRHRPYA